MKPRIVLLSAFLSPFRSGAEACAEEVSARLQDTYDIVIVTARLSRTLPLHDCLPSGVHIRRIGLGLQIDKWLYPFLAPVVARSIQPALLHAVLETFAGLALFFCKFLMPKVPRLLTLQTTNRSLLKGPIIRAAMCVTAISSALVETAKTSGRSDVILIPNGIDLPVITQARSTEKKVDSSLLFVGRLEPMKGVDTLLQALATIKERTWTLRIVGDGSERPRLEAMKKKLGLTSSVTFTGKKSGADLWKEFARAEIFCGLSRSEALGNVFLEAEAAGCAVIATRVGGIPDIVQDEETGLLVPPDEPETAAHAIRRLLTDAPLRKRLQENGTKNSLAYDWSIVAKRYGDLYAEMLQKCYKGYTENRMVPPDRRRAPLDIFKTTVRYFPTVSINILAENKNSEFLFLKRKNNPVKEWWWVPGGRLMNGETMAESVLHVLKAETGLTGEVIALSKEYMEEIWDTKDFTEADWKNYDPETRFVHYISTAAYVRIHDAAAMTIDDQSAEILWSKTPPKEHPYLLAYFQAIERMGYPTLTPPPPPSPQKLFER